ncbi:TPA: nucleotide exchange factor GrpE [Candidatus Woesearchaeota archaeon]|nr:nucleotide exchange factor GrpE [Candidatus Woesearchaeota archaeon]
MVKDKENDSEVKQVEAEQEQKQQTMPECHNCTIKDQTIAELTELVQRTQANLENYRKQMEKRIEEIQQTAARSIIIQLLPALDNLDLALRSAAAHPEEFIKGVAMIQSQLQVMLEQQGVQPIMTTNQKFDPHLHEALLKEESALPENTILEEFQKGYLLHGRVLRHARVKISKKEKK